MIIPTMTTSGYLYTVNKYRQRWLLELEKRKAARYLIAIFTCVVIIVMAWLVRP